MDRLRYDRFWTIERRLVYEAYDYAYCPHRVLLPLTPHTSRMAS
jgi:hypothetical protein